MKILYTSSEAYPMVKTGGLGDVAGTLPTVLSAMGEDIRLMLPAYPQVLDMAEKKRDLIGLDDPLGVGEARLIEAQMPDSGTPLILVDCPPLYQRPGGPYVQDNGDDWPDNHLRFALFSHAAVQVWARGEEIGWSPDVIHANDWQTGLIPAYLHFLEERTAKTVLTIHNLQYQGVFDADIFPRLGLPPEAFSTDGLEFYGKVSYLKAGLRYANHITTVSPTYAKEIQGPEEGFGLEGLLQERSDSLTGILNGIDCQIWNPALDRLIEKRYTANTLDAKMVNKRALQRELGLPEDPDVPLLGLVSRLAEQKGIDLVINAISQLNELGVQIAILGTGEHWWESAVIALAAENPNVAARITYDEGLSHRIIAGSDMFLMPSRFEPCGLTQMYSMSYGTLPIVRATGGLKDTVTDVSDENNGTGFVFEAPDHEALAETVARAVALYARKPDWRKIQQRAMAHDYTWANAAKVYLELYASL